MKKLFSAVLSMLLLVSFIPYTSALYKPELTDEKIELSEDGMYLYVENCTQLPDLTDYENLRDICLENCIVGDPDFMKDTDIVQATFTNCEFNVETICWPGEMIQVYIDSCRFESNDALKSIKSEEIYFEGMCFDDLSFFDSSASVKRLLLIDSSVTSLNGIQNLTTVCDLDLTGTFVTDISPVTSLENLEYLTLDGSFLKDISPLVDTNIKGLYIRYPMHLKNPEVIREITSLETLNLVDAGVAFTQEMYDLAKEYETFTDYDAYFQLLKEAEELAAQIIPEGASDEEVIEIVTSFVVEHMEYDHEMAEGGGFALNKDTRLRYGLDGKGVCDNYTALTTILLEYAGIEVYECSGINHIWNLVNLDGEYYWIDTTWMDNPENIIDKQWYMVPIDDENFLTSHGMMYPLTGVLKDLSEGRTDDGATDVESPSVQPEEEKKAEERNSNTVIYIAIAAVGSVVIVGTVIAVIILKKKKSRSNVM